MVYGVKWPALADLRALFVERHGPQDWLQPEVTNWPVSSSLPFEEVQALNDLDIGLKDAQAPNAPIAELPQGATDQAAADLALVRSNT
jgi:hypothetical protein